MYTHRFKQLGNQVDTIARALNQLTTQVQILSNRASAASHEGIYMHTNAHSVQVGLNPYSDIQQEHVAPSMHSNPCNIDAAQHTSAAEHDCPMHDRHEVCLELLSDYDSSNHDFYEHDCEHSGCESDENQDTPAKMSMQHAVQTTKPKPGANAMTRVRIHAPEYHPRRRLGNPAVPPAA